MAKINKRNGPVTIIGYVDLIDEDDAGAGIIISTEDHEAYRADPNEQGQRLMNLIGEKIQAQGAVTQTEDGENRISVTKFEILEWQETYED